MSTVCPVNHVVCPYNKSHVIRTERIQFHLTKCEQNAGGKTYAVCPFNSTHLIPATEINNHKMNLCPDRNKLDTFLYETADCTPLFPVKQINIECQENWDTGEVYSYDPQKVLSEKKLLVLKQVVPPAERKKFQAEQRKKFQAPSNEPISSQYNKTKPRQPNSKSIIQENPKKVEVKPEVPAQKLQPVIEKIENITITEKTKSDQFELVVGKKKNKKNNAKSSDNQKEAGKTKGAEPKKTAPPKVKKQPVLNEKNTNEILQVNRDEPDVTSMEPKEDEFIVVTKKKNKRKQ